MIIGTSAFVSKAAAIRYYRPYGFNAKDVQAKLDHAEIFIGKPPHNPENGERVILLGDEGRYGIVTPEGRKAQ
jgi:hypothetical protein